MKLLFDRLLPILLITCFGATALQAQYRETAELPASPPPSVLFPEPTYWYLGFFAGSDINRHSGDFYTVLCNRVFNDAKGNGVTLGAQLEHVLSPSFRWALRVGYNDFSAKASTFVPNVPTLFNDNHVENVDHTYQGDIKLGYISVSPMIEYTPFGGLYLVAGPSVGFLLKGTYQCQDVVPDSLAFDLNQSTTRGEDYIDIPGALKIRADIRVGIGYNLRLAGR